MEKLILELKSWLDKQMITSANIGSIRRRLSMPWNSDWNAVVRDETAIRENIYPKNLGEVSSTVKDMFQSDIL